MTEQTARRTVGIVALPDFNESGAAVMVYSDGSYAATHGVDEERAVKLAQAVLEVTAPTFAEQLSDVITVAVPTPISRSAFEQWYTETRPGADIPDPSDTAMQQLVSEYLAAAPADEKSDDTDDTDVQLEAELSDLVAPEQSESASERVDGSE